MALCTALRLTGASLVFALAGPACTGGPSGSQGTSETGASGDSEDTLESEAEEAESTETGQADLDPQIEFQLYEAQPMVVDVHLSVQIPLDDAAAEVSWSHQFDPGVQFVHVLSSEDELEHTFRIRGLAPETAHQVSVQVSANGQSESLDGEFTTPTALPGFEPTVPVIGQSPNPDIYRLFDWSRLNGGACGIMLSDAEGQVRWYWGREFVEGAQSVIEGVKLLDDGSVLFTVADRVTIRDELSNIVWQIAATDYDLAYFHHETLQLPNGNFMTLGREFGTFDYGAQGELVIAGDTILEFDADGVLVWTWSSLEHLDPMRVRAGFEPLIPSIFDPVSGDPAKDWTHANSIEYSPDEDTLLLSLRHQDWILKIDHVTGDVLWKLGDEGDFTLESGTWFFHQHAPQWQADGSLLLYDNASDNPYTPVEAWAARAVRYELDYTAMTATQVWEDDMPDFLSPAMGDVDVMPNGNYLVTDSFLGLEVGIEAIHARIREIDPSASPQIQWTFATEPGRIMYRGVPVDRMVGAPAP